MKNNQTIFSLYSNCIPVKGASVSIICDLQRNRYISIPDGLFEILTEHKNQDVSVIKLSYQNQFDTIIDEYLGFLIEKELGFWNDEIENFPDIDIDFESPSIINNAIIDIDGNYNHDFKKYFSELEVLGCKYIELRFFEAKEANEINSIVALLKNHRFKNIDIFLKYSYGKKGTLDIILPWFDKYPIGKVVIHSSPFDKNYSDKFPYHILFMQQSIESEQCCGVVSKGYFNANLMLFAESLNHNSCLNKKISVDKSGFIKNCPSIKQSFGHALENSFIDVVSNVDFKSYWNINKDQISVCKDCQFRYICTDCRAYLNDKFDKPKKCSYDPYTNKWN